MLSNKTYIGDKLIAQSGFSQTDATNVYNKVYLGDKDITDSLEEIKVTGYRVVPNYSSNITITKDGICAAVDTTNIVKFYVDFESSLNINTGDKLFLVFETKHTNIPATNARFDISEFNFANVNAVEGTSTYAFESEHDVSKSYITFSTSIGFDTNSGPVYIKVKLFRIKGYNRLYIGDTQITPEYSENIVLNSGEAITSSEFIIKEYELSEPLTAGDKITATIWGECNNNKGFRIWLGRKGASATIELFSNDFKVTNGKISRAHTITSTQKLDTIQVYILNNQEGVYTGTINKIKIERGDNILNSVWTPSTGDVYNLIKSSKYNKAIGKNHSHAISFSFDTDVILKAGDSITFTVEDMKRTQGDSQYIRCAIYDYTSNKFLLTSIIVPIDVKTYSFIVGQDFVTGHNIRFNIYLGSPSSMGQGIAITKLMLTKGVQPHVWKPAKSEINNG